MKLKDFFSKRDNKKLIKELKEELPEKNDIEELSEEILNIEVIDTVGYEGPLYTDKDHTIFNLKSAIEYFKTSSDSPFKGIIQSQLEEIIEKIKY